MNVGEYLRRLARAKAKKALPILSFPAVQKMGVTVCELVKSGEEQARAMTVIARETPAAAAVSLMDLSVEAEAFGAAVRFQENEVPAIIGRLIADADDAEALTVPQIGAGRTGECVQGIRLAKRAIADRPVLAGVIGPYSLAGRLLGVTEAMYLCYDEPETLHRVLDKAAEFITAYCGAFRDAGADGVVLAEPLAGVLSADLCAAFSAPYVRRIIDAVQTDRFAVIYHNCGSAVSRMLPVIFSSGAAAYHFGNAVDMTEILENAPADALCMGNIDPVGQFVAGTPESMAAATRDLMNACAKYPNFLISSGCDIPARARWENIDAFFRAVEA